MKTLIVVPVLLAVLFSPSVAISDQGLLEYSAKQKGMHAYTNKQYELAIACFNRAIREDANDASLFCFRGLVYYSKEQYEEAIADYTEAIRLDPTDTRAYNNRGLAYVEVKSYGEAIKDYTEAIRINPNEDYVYCNRGLAYAQRGDYEEAIADFTRSLKHNPKNGTAYTSRGISHLRVERIEKAIEDCDEAIKLDANNYVALLNRGYAHMKADHRDQAIRDLTEVIHIKPTFAHAYIGLSHLYAISPNKEWRNEKKALEHGKTACELTQWRNAVALQSLAFAYAEAGDFDQAVKWQKTALTFSDQLTKQQLRAFQDRLKLFTEGKPYRREQ